MNEAEQTKNLAVAFRDVAREYAEFPAIISPEAVLNYRDLWAVVRSFAGRMQEAGVGRGSLVALNTADMVVSVATLLATSLLGAEFVLASKLLASVKFLQPTHFFKSPEVTGSDAVTFLDIDLSWLPQDAQGENWSTDGFDGYEDQDAPWMYLHTSGSTGTPKYFTLSQRLVFDRTAAIADDFSTGQTCLAVAYKCTARPFYARTLGLLLKAGALVNSPKASFWREAGVNMVCGSPRQILEMLKSQAISPKIARLEVGGSGLTEAEIAQLLDSFETVIHSYGASETNKSYEMELRRDPDGTISTIGHSRGSVIEILDDAGALCAPGQIGAVRIRNDYCISTYLNNAGAASKAFRDGWFYPGDQATWDENGVLRIVGREDDLINLGGLKLNADLVDTVMRNLPGIRDAVCFKNPKTEVVDELVAFVEFEDIVHRANCIEMIRAACKARLGVEFTPRNIHPIDKVPRTENGKPQRAKCKELLLERVSRLAAEGRAT